MRTTAGAALPTHALNRARRSYLNGEGFLEAGSMTLGRLRRDASQDEGQMDSLRHMMQRQREKEKADELRVLNMRQNRLKHDRQQDTDQVLKLMKELQEQKRRELTARMEREQVKKALQGIEEVRLAAARPRPGRGRGLAPPPVAIGSRPPTRPHPFPQGSLQELRQEKQREMEELQRRRASLADEERELSTEVERLTANLRQKEESLEAERRRRREQTEAALRGEEGADKRPSHQDTLRAAASRHIDRASQLKTERAQLERQRADERRQLEQRACAGDGMGPAAPQHPPGPTLLPQGAETSALSLRSGTGRTRPTTAEMCAPPGLVSPGGGRGAGGKGRPTLPSNAPTHPHLFALPRPCRRWWRRFPPP